MAYSEIINEIQEQINEVLAQIASRNVRLQELQDEIADIELHLPQLQQQITGLETLKAQTQTLIDSQGGSSLNVNLNVTTSGNATVNHSIS